MLTKRNFLKTAAGAAIAAGMPLPVLADWRHGRPGFFSARDIAREGYVFGLPLVMNYGTMYEFVIDQKSGQFKAPFNQIFSEARVFTPQDTTVITPNSDTPYSLLWLDLRAEPMVLHVPEIETKRYYSVQLIDGNTYNYGYVGSRTTGNGEGSYLVAGPGWTGAAPEGVKAVFQCDTDFSLLIFRTQLFAPDDLDNVKVVQAGFGAEPLSSFLKQPAAIQPAEPAWPVFDKAKVADNFFEYLDFALTLNPPQPNEAFIREQLARIGVGPGKGFELGALSEVDKAEILLGLKEGKDMVDKAVANAGTGINGWRVAESGGDRAFYHGDWLTRAGIAQAGIYGNDAEEAAYPLTRTDGDGTPLDGSKANYTLTFAKDEFPPVNAFWSVTMYDGKTQLLIENPINRYLINSPMLSTMKLAEDGSLTIYIQKDDPGGDKSANWLPAPDGPIYIVMRLYWPKTEAPSILPIGTGSWKPPAVTKA